MQHYFESEVKGENITRLDDKGGARSGTKIKNCGCEFKVRNSPPIFVSEHHCCLEQ